MINLIKLEPLLSQFITDLAIRTISKLLLNKIKPLVADATSAGGAVASFMTLVFGETQESKSFWKEEFIKAAKERFYVPQDTKRIDSMDFRKYIIMPKLFMGITQKVKLTWSDEVSAKMDALYPAQILFIINPFC